MIRYCTYRDNDQARRLLMECFTEDQEYLDLFLNHCLDKIGLCYELEGEIVSLLYALPISYVSNETENGFTKEFQGQYLYAVCTAEKHRGKGYCSALLDELRYICEKVGNDFLILRPSESSPRLTNFYRMRGFTIPLFRKKNLPRFEVSENIPLLHARELFLMRRNYWRRNFFEWGPSMLKYIISEATINPQQEIQKFDTIYALVQPIAQDFRLSSNDAPFSFPME